MPSDLSKVSGRPSKEFFINMITKDLGVVDCVLDLVDNPIDKAVRLHHLDVMKLLTNGVSPTLVKGAGISLTLSKERIRIADTCGGIPVSEARDSIFRFGNPDVKELSVGLSVYGIGMKRAFFKLGNVIQMTSSTETESFSIDIDVEAWKAKGDDDWDFKFAHYGPLEKAAKSRIHATDINITQLREGIGTRLIQVSFENELKRRLASTYALFLKAGVTIKVNDSPITSLLPTVGRVEGIIPARRELKHNGVDILIIAGITPKDDRRVHGWYVFCNGRMVLEADKTERTGWGDGVPQFHSKFNHFVGYVYFRSDDVRHLPWTTTKQGVFFESPVYQAALPEMKIQSRPILDFLSDLYPTELGPEGVVEREYLKKVKGISLDQVERRDTAFLIPDLKSEKKKRENQLEWIRFRKPLKDIERIRKCLKKQMSPSQIGSYAFDYLIKQECQE